MINKFRGEYHFLSNFFPVNIESDGIIYPSVEHYYVSRKIDTPSIIDGTFYEVNDFRIMISKVEYAGSVKKIGQRLQANGRIRSDWGTYKFKVMKWALREKFNNPVFKKLLMDTGDMEIIEGNTWHDNIFGSCICDDCGNKGKNLLGKMIMDVRREIRGNGFDDLFK